MAAEMSEDWFHKNKKELVTTAKIGIFGGVAMIGSVLLFADSALDLAGDAHRARSDEQVEELALAQKTPLYESASPASQYSLLFLNNQDGSSGKGVIVNRLEGGNGLASAYSTFRAAFSPDGYQDYVKFGQDCLIGTSYDTRASEIRGWASGDISAVASVNVDDDVVTVYPAATNAEPLRFAAGDGELLHPADKATQQTLDAYGCEEIKL